MLPSQPSTAVDGIAVAITNTVVNVIAVVAIPVATAATIAVVGVVVAISTTVAIAIAVVAIPVATAAYIALPSLLWVLWLPSLLPLPL